MPLHDRGLSSYGMPVNPRGLAFAELRSAGSCRQETAGLQHLMKTVEAVDSGDVLQRLLLLATYEFLSNWRIPGFPHQKLG